MSLLSGSLSLKRYIALGPVPTEEDLGAGLARCEFKPFMDGTDEERYGWVDWRNLLIHPPDVHWLIQDRFAVFALRVDTRKIPPLLLKSHVDLLANKIKQEKDLSFLGKEARIALQDEVKEQLLRQVLPTPKVVEIAWDLKMGLLWTSSTSARHQDMLHDLFGKSFGVDLQPLAPVTLAQRVAPGLPLDVLLALDPLDLSLEDA